VPDPPPKPPRRILLLSYWYPPAIGAAAERVLGFARHLAELDWQVHVLTAERASPINTPGVTVHTVPDPLAVRGQSFADYDPRQQPSKVKSFLKRFVFPDRFARWRKTAAERGRQLVRETPYDVIFASFPPASVVQLALDLSDESDAKLVLDFRDRWLGPGGYEPTSKKSLALHLALEREAARKADLVVTVSKAMAEAVADEQGLDAEKSFVVPNGYSAPNDSAGAAAQPQEPSSDAEPDTTPPARTGIAISHVGTLIARNRPDLLFESLAAIKGNASLGGVTFRFVGNLSRGYLVAAGLSPLVQTTGILPRGEARRAMRDADGLLLLTGTYVGQWGHNAKLFEYIQSGRPVLCLEEEPGSNDRKLLERFISDRAFFAPVDDPEAIAEALTSLKAYIAGRSGPALELDPAFREFSRAAQTAQLAERLEALLSDPAIPQDHPRQ